MPADELQELIRQITQLSEKQQAMNDKLDMYMVAQQRDRDDHEKRIRDLESKRSDHEAQLGEIRQRINVFNGIQASFTGLAAFVVYYFKK